MTHAPLHLLLQWWVRQGWECTVAHGEQESAVLIVLVCGYGDMGRVYAYSSWFVLCVLCLLRCIRQCHVYGWYCWYFSPCGRGVSFVVVRPLMLRIKAGMNQKDSDAGLVLFSALCFLLLSSDSDVRHLGRYGPEGQVCSTGVWPRSSNAQWHIWLVLLVTISTLFPVIVGRTRMLGILVGTDQKVRFAFSCCSHVHCVQRQVCNDRCHGLWGAESCSIFRSCCSCRSSTFLSLCRGRFPWSL